MKILATIIASTMMLSVAHAETLLVTTNDNHYRLTRNLSHKECVFLKHRALGEPATDAEIKRAREQAELKAKENEERERRYALICRGYEKEKTVMVESGLGIRCEDREIVGRVIYGYGMDGTSSLTIGKGNDAQAAECF